MISRATTLTVLGLDLAGGRVREEPNSLFSFHFQQGCVAAERAATLINNLVINTSGPASRVCALPLFGLMGGSRAGKVCLSKPLFPSGRNTLRYRTTILTLRLIMSQLGSSLVPSVHSNDTEIPAKDSQKPRIKMQVTILSYASKITNTKRRPKRQGGRRVQSFLDTNP